MNMKENKGITLVTLVITIILLLILAGVSINFVMDKTSIEDAEKAANKVQEQVEQYEQMTNEVRNLYR